MIWNPNLETGQYPPLRIVWNVLWLPVIFLGAAITSIGIFAQSGVERVKDYWEEILP